MPRKVFCLSNPLNWECWEILSDKTQLKISIVAVITTNVFICSLSTLATLQRALGQKESSAFAQGTGGEGTIHLEEYFVQKHVSMVDTRGFFLSDEKLFEECLNIMSGR